MISKCYTSNIRYLSVTEDRLLTTYSVNIVRDIKQKKESVLVLKGEESFKSSFNKDRAGNTGSSSVFAKKTIFRVNQANNLNNNKLAANDTFTYKEDSLTSNKEANQF